jgi:peptidoglycan/LPS O-acetylase OafA/YrhL
MPRRPATVLVAAVVQAAEAAGVLAASILAGIDTGAGRSYHADSGIALTLIGAATALALGCVAAGLARTRRWSRTPAMLTQLFVGIVGIYLVQGHRLDWGVPGIALAVAGFAALLARPSMRALAGGPAAPVSRDRDGPRSGGG